MFKRKYFYQQAVLDGSDAGATGGDTGSQDTQSQSNQDTQNTSLLSQGKSAEEIAAAAASKQEFDKNNAWMPEKYRVTKEDGSFDIEASAKKQAEAYTHLATKLGSGDIPPKTADEYTFTVPEALKDQWNPAEDGGFNDFKKDALAAGFTQKQFEFAVGRHLEMLAEVGGGVQQVSEQEATEKLRKLWPDENSFKGNLNKSDRAVRAYANPGSADVLGSYVNLERKFGNDPDFIALMANIGKETAEDIPPMGSVLPDASIAELQASKAYWDANDPKHAETVKKVQDHYTRKFK
jgi:hypothetical protein